MTIKKIVTIPVILISLLTILGTARADILVNSIPDEDAGANLWENMKIASQFTTGGEGKILSKVTLSMGDYNSVPPLTNTFSLSIYSQGGVGGSYTYGQPTTLLEILSGNTRPISEDLYAYTSTGLTLDANTVYWVVAESQSTVDFSGYTWNTTSTETQTLDPITGASIQHITSKYGNNPWSINTGNIHASMSIEVIPEPSTISLILLFGGPLLGIRRFLLI